MTLTERINQVVPRCRAFYGAGEPGHLLLNVHVPADIPAIPPLYSFDLDRQLGEWLDFKLAAARAEWEAKDGLDDDTIPSFCPHFGIAEHSAWLGMEVRLQETTCLPIPMLNSLDEVSRLKLSTQTRWYRYMKQGYDHLRGRQDGSFALSVRGSFAAMDLANAMRGDELFTDFLIDPDGVHHLLTFCMEAVNWWYNQVCAWSDPIQDGQVFMYNNSWMGPDCLGHITNDAAMLCGPRIYDEFGFPYEQTLCERYKQVLYHVHNEKLHFVPAVARLPGLALLEVTNDPKTAPALQDMPRILASTGSANLLLHGDSDEVREFIGVLATRNVFLDVQCRDRADAADLIAFVRAHAHA
jgi:hypothetical protein